MSNSPQSQRGRERVGGGREVVGRGIGGGGRGVGGGRERVGGGWKGDWRGLEGHSSMHLLLAHRKAVAHYTN